MKDLGKLINKMINKAVVGCDKYVHNDSTWLIFTDEKKWVIELTKDGTLWYNYNFFKNLLKVLSLDVVENQNYITKWVEETIITEVNYTGSNTRDESHQVEDTIQNGVKHTVASDCLPSVFVEDTIQNGVKHTEKSLQIDGSCVVEDVIQNGIKETHDDVYHHKGRVDGVIKNGIKE